MMKRLLTLFALALMAAGCGASLDAANDDDVIVPEGKEDDFFSSGAAEYWVAGTGTVTVEDGLTDAAALKRAKELVQLKNVAVSWFLNTYITDKEDTDTNKAYGGFAALTRFASEADGALTTTDHKTFQFPYKVQVAGAKTLISKLGGGQFTLALGKVSNADLARLEYNHEWYRDSPWDAFDPSKLTADQLEKMAMTITKQTASTDAWLAYDRLLADGEISIAVHFGWDYWDRYDLKGSKNLYNFLVDNGFASPVASYDKMDRTSGPLTRTIQSNGKPVVVKIWIFHPGDPANHVLGPDPDTDAGGKILEADMRDSLAHREVIVFEGHSGPLYGFALANWRKTDEGDMDDSKIPTAQMPRSYQIVLANGCDTYDLGQAFWLNPAKSDHENLNVITTTNFSNAGTEASAERLLKALFNQTGNKLVPVKVSDLTHGLDGDQGYGFQTMYGVHGVDHNPKYDPMSDASKLCASCTSDAGCGADGNRCTKISTSVKACTFACIDDSGCPSGYSCRAVAGATSRSIKTHQCVPTSLRCR
ncbi:MAG: hypothetical protein ACXVDD_11990 [Polyangia bacterium]